MAERVDLGLPGKKEAKKEAKDKTYLLSPSWFNQNKALARSLVQLEARGVFGDTSPDVT